MEGIVLGTMVCDNYQFNIYRNEGCLLTGTGLGGADGAIVVDMKHFQQFSMDNETHVATIGPGLSLGDIDTLLYNAGGRAMSHGICPEIRAGGHLTIGGLGLTSRQWGMSLDHIEEVEVVLPNSSIVRASETEDADLLFAVKGAAASFGVVTEFKVRTQLAPKEAIQYSYSFKLGSAAQRARLFADWQDLALRRDLSRKFTSDFICLQDSVIVKGVFFGSKKEYNALRIEHHLPGSDSSKVLVLDDWLGIVTHVVDDLAVRLGGSMSTYFYAKSLGFTRDTLMPPSTITSLFTYLDKAKKGTITWFVTFSLVGGAINDYPKNATAYPHRDVIYWMQSFAINALGPVLNSTYDFLDGINELVARDLPGCAGHAYLGCPDPRMEGAERAYWGSNLGRLEDMKGVFDPVDVFWNPQGVGVPVA